ncbi:3'-5' DNA helicase [Saxophila tyrrhenica]|uniref:ATP-dependent DNA helicase n=1 Tax=Saxophila tyrrhenica TaxID=1690608 RepID=A0AAV9PFL7_9PEZI|nr:3'-5' DNA helicase [Saxophila tyrrhenica]
MPHSEDYGSDDDDTLFIAAATQVEASQHHGFENSPRPAKRQRTGPGPSQVDGPASQELEWSGTDDEAPSLPKHTDGGSTLPTQDRTASDSEAEEDPEYYFPGELGEDGGEAAAKQSKYRIHAPVNGAQFPDQIFTQTQVGLDSSPSHFRGAVWKRPKPPPPAPPLFGERPSTGNGVGQVNGRFMKGAVGSRQTTLNNLQQNRTVARGMTYQSDAQLAARLQAEEETIHRRTNQSRPADNSIGQHAVSHELEDLPSDAFSSSSPEKSPQKDIIEISSQYTASQAPVHGMRGPQHGLKQMTIFGQAATQELSTTQTANKKHAWPLKNKEEKPTHHKLDDKAMETWVYPTNLGTIRDYQYNIVSRSLFHNTLVALPTGLGKTFIAATVMLNYFRWTKDAQIVFMAPTKPLIAQQMEACYNIVGIPRHETVLMTGETQPARRAEEWLERRVFFMTPQTVINDLKTGICDPKKIVLIVVDEAHKATGAYAYTEVVKFMHRFNNSFRIQALTATPGSTVESVQAVIDNLGVSRVQLRTEQSLDIRQYTHRKNTETELFDYSDEQILIMEHMSKALKPVLDKLCTQNAYWQRDPMGLTPYGLTTGRQKYMSSDAGRKAAMPIKGMVNALFTVLMSVAHSIPLLKNHGIGPFHSSVRDFQRKVDSGEMKGKYAAQIVQSEDFTKMMSHIRSWTNNPDFIGHPKLQYLREVVLNHFLDTGEGMQGSVVPPSATRVMVFASYRDSTEEICRVLKRNEPMIRPHVFVGQAASKGSEGMDQKRQNAVIQDFKSGKYNTLVATSIGEEGLDIGDVDLIVCYDASASPIRMLQRIGRTGRKRVGRVQLLLMKGKEENDYAKAQDNYSYIQKTIADASKYTYHEDKSPRILPKGVQPVVDRRVIEIPVENSQPIDLSEKSKKAKGKGKAKRPPKKFHMPDGVRTGFVKASRMESDDSGSEENTAPKKRAPAKKKATPKASKAPVERILEPAQLPFLEDVLLTRVQQKDLERKYAHTADDDEADGVIRPPDTDKSFTSWTLLGRTKYVPHSRATHAVEKALKAIRSIDDEKLARWKTLAGQQDDLLASHQDARRRIVSPAARRRSFERDLPADSTTPVVKKAATKGRSKKETPAQRTKSFQSNATASDNDLPVAKKPRGRPRKNQPLARTASYGSAAAEGAESSPEPTPAHLRIGTQGIDLGTQDTSGEDDDEEPDSELEEFVVRSDQPIEMASSSQRLPDDTQPPRPQKNLRLKKKAERPTVLFSEDEVEDDDHELGLNDFNDIVDDDSDDIQEVDAPQAATGATRRKKKKTRVVESDSDE